MAPFTAPRAEAGNHRASARARLGNAPASAAPNRNRTVTRVGKPRTAPVTAVNKLQDATMRVRVARWPMRSPSQPMGTSKIP